MQKRQEVAFASRYGALFANFAWAASLASPGRLLLSEGAAGPVGEDTGPAAANPVRRLAEGRGHNRVRHLPSAQHPKEIYVVRRKMALLQLPRLLPLCSGIKQTMLPILMIAFALAQFSAKNPIDEDHVAQNDG